MCGKRDDEAELEELAAAVRRAARRRPRGPAPIAEALSELLARRGYAAEQGAAELERAWKTAAGPLLAGRTCVGRLRRGVLEVTAAHSAVIQELTFEKQRLLARLRQLLPDAGVRDLRFRAGAVWRSGGAPGREHDVLGDGS